MLDFCLLRMTRFKVFWDIFRKILKEEFPLKIWVSEPTMGVLEGKGWYYRTFSYSTTDSLNLFILAGAKFGGYGSFLPTYQRSPSVWSQPKSPLRVQKPSTPRSPNCLPPEVYG